MSFICQYCHRPFTMKHHLTRHIKEKRCKYLKNLSPQVSLNPSTSQYPQIENEVKLLKKQIEELKNINKGNDAIDIHERITAVEKRLEQQEKEPRISNNVLQVICVTGSDNYLDMLTNRIGNFEQAVDYIKDCALSDLSGDCKLIEKIYMEQPVLDTTNIYFSDKGRTKVIYYNERKEQVSDNRIAFGRKLANNLQNSYLKGINYLINKNLDSHTCPNKLLEDYDLLTWNNHIYNLSDNSYQRKIINQLSIPVKS